MSFSNKITFASIHKSTRHFFRKNEFLLLLIALLAFILLPAFFMNPSIKDGIIYGLLISVLLIGMYELSDSIHGFRFGILFSLLAIGFNSFNLPISEDLLFLLRMGSLITFFGMLTIHVLIRMRKAKRVTTNVVYAAVNGYLLIGLIGGMGFRLINHFYPSSFVFTSGLEAKIDDLTYFSFTTLSTLGYGDITPISPPGQSLTIFLSICGQMYTAIVIGIIIGKFIIEKRKKE